MGRGSRQSAFPPDPGGGRPGRPLGPRPAATPVGASVHMMGAQPARIPLFPLAGAILLPRAQLPLHIFEPRYRDMVRDALAGQGRIGMIQPRFGEIEGEMSE